MLKFGLLMLSLACLACGTQSPRHTPEMTAEAGAAGMLVAPDKPRPADIAKPPAAQPTARPEASAGASPVVDPQPTETPSGGGYGGAMDTPVQSEQNSPPDRTDGAGGAAGSVADTEPAGGSAGLSDVNDAHDGGPHSLDGEGGLVLLLGGSGGESGSFGDSTDGGSAGLGGTTTVDPCDSACADDQICEDGLCVWCPAGMVPVDGQCADAPECPNELVLCDGDCTDLQSDHYNCGACGRSCDSNNPRITVDCVAGQCDHAQGQFIAFASSTLVVGTFQASSDSIGDEICQELADAASLGGTFKAWLAPLADFSIPPNGSYYTTGGALVAYSWDALLSQDLEHPINRDENGDVLVGPGVAWTGIAAQGSIVLTRDDCNNWAGPFAEFGTVGHTNATARLWTESNLRDCSLSAHLYCFEECPSPVRC